MTNTENGPPGDGGSAIDRSARYWDSHNLAHSEDVRYWLAVPEVRRNVNRRMTGNPEKLFIADFLERVTQCRENPVGRALSVGCGAGDLERGVVGEGFVEQIDGIDVGEGSLAVARERAEAEGFSAQISYTRSDAASFLQAQAEAGKSYDLVFFHGVLHHLEDLEVVIDATSEVLRGERPGLIYVDEYVGPSRTEWEEEYLGFAAGIFGKVSAEDRRTPRVWPPIAWEDPTEMIRSSEILPLLRSRFDVLEDVPYFGNVLMPLVCSLRSSRIETSRLSDLLDEAMALEDYLISRKLLEPLYSVFVGRPQGER